MALTAVPPLPLSAQRQVSLWRAPRCTSGKGDDRAEC
eukprot:CAMPEP_0119388628 /NCGR_PEP_ID=MMETSP1334-20130426/105844_1 /TAXON_ID=127549 /ORGANISM="Calcidiscus leptoporus, Strain RCC1130" /LENGTH=36 /DNA_ID= /DNA_START= /DNA_END= /DNA_ORIENTATION=